MKRYFFFAVLCLSVVSACKTKPAPKSTAVAPKPSSATAVKAAPANDQSAMKTQMLPAVNTLRQSGCKCGAAGEFPAAKALVWNDKLAEAALRHAQDMAKSQRLSHTSSDGSGLPERVKRVGYTYSLIAENICEGAETPTEAIALWKTSDGHCKNMLNGRFTEFGAAKVGAYWVQVFGVPM